MKKKIVVALGGNALGDSALEQKELLKEASKPLAQLIKKGHELVFVHGNGPQVGMINIAFNGQMPLAECTAMSQGYIGFHLQNALHNSLKKSEVKRNVATVISQVEVNKTDFAFKNLSKPIGAFHDTKPKDNFEYIEDSGRGYRRVVASPKPLDILELENIKSLIKDGNVVIACGGGGIPVIKKDNTYETVDAVIDKDYASSLLADKLDADVLMILTEVDQVAINFGKENQEWLETMTVKEAKEYLDMNHFGKGSMEPKVRSAIEFVEKNPKREAIITSLKNADIVMETKNKTVIIN